MDQVRRKVQRTLFLLLVFASSSLFADAIVRSKAMLATTIAEYFIEDSRIRVELEIGLNDLPAFRNLLPNDIHRKMGYGEVPLKERLQTFFSKDMAIYVNDKPLDGYVVKMGPGKRIMRDEITGEPLPIQNQDLELVVKAEFEFPFEGHPDAMTLVAPAGSTPADIGFVLYHKGIAINDFRYLSSGHTVTLDWRDPWYSSFTTRNLQRQYAAPMSGFIYVEPFEVRKEIIVRPKDLQRWVDLGLEGRDTIPVEIQGDIKLKVAEFLSRHQPVTIDGRAVNGLLDRVGFLERKLTSSRVIDPPEELNIDSAIMGVITVYPISALPQKVEMHWDLWDEYIQRVPVSAVDEAGPLPQYVEPDWADLVWENFLQFPTVPGFDTMNKPPADLLILLVLWRWPLIIATVLVLLWTGVARLKQKRLKAVPATLSILCLLVTAAIVYATPQVLIADNRANSLVSSLLHNIYRAFDYREESDIYDVLDRSVEGDLLTRIYLETQRSLELANQGGARAKVKDIDVTALQTERLADGSGFLARTTWVVSGSVGHWGHIHQRRNQYQADLIIEPVDGVWKLTAMDMLQEERL